MLFSRKISYFRESYIHGSFNRAGKAIHKSASSVNRLVNELERDLGQQLFVRSSGGITPTRIADELFSLTEDSLAGLTSILPALPAPQNGPAVVQVLGTPSTVSQIVAQCSDADAPGYRISVSSMHENTDFLRYYTHHAEIFLGYDMIEGTNAPIRVLFRRAFAVGALMRPDQPLTKQKGVTLEQCLKIPCMVPDRSWPLRKKLDALAGEGGFGSSVQAANSVDFARSEILKAGRISLMTLVGVYDDVRAGDIVYRALVSEPGATAPILTQDVCIAVDRSKQTRFHNRVINKLEHRIDEMWEFERLSARRRL